MNTWYFTLANNQGGPGYVKVFAIYDQHARHIMCKKYSNKWCSQYESLDQLHDIDKIELDTLGETWGETWTSLTAE
jgi:hypothetical protein